MIRVNTFFPALLAGGILLLFIFFPKDTLADDPDLTVDEWLVLDPVTMPLPAFHDVESIRGERFDEQKLLELGVLDHSDWWPSAGDAVDWDRTTQLLWNSQSGADLTLDAAEDDTPHVGWAGVYVETDRWTRAELTVKGHHPFAVYLNGDQVTQQPRAVDEESDAEEARQTIELPRGKHFLLINTVKSPDTEADWSIRAELNAMSPDDALLHATTDSERFLALPHIMDVPRVSSLSTAPAGDLTAVTITQQLPPDGRSESRIELRTTDDGEIYRTFGGGMQIGNLQWAPEERQFAYVDRTQQGADLWLVDLATGEKERLLDSVEDFGSFSWSPTGDFLVYSISESPDPDDSGVQKLRKMEDRRPGFHTRSFLYRLNLPEGTTQRLTAGELTTGLQGVSPDGEQLLFSRSHIDYSERPYTRGELSILDLNTLQVDSLFAQPFMGSAEWSPDGEQILVAAGPSAFGDAGIDLPDDRISNDYDTQAYLYTIETGEIDPITEDFDPSIAQAQWHEEENAIFFTTTDRSFVNLYRYDIDDRTFDLIETEGDALQSFSLADRGTMATYTSSGTSDPQQAWLLDITTGSSTHLLNPAAKEFAPVRLGEVQDWPFTNERDEEIEGHVYYPPDFDASEEYPVIVYYYGGVVPTTRSFGGGYPYELWAADGYLVYVLQPTGTIGYGQEFSSLHVNDWGKIVADEIIDGVSQFLDAHNYADRDNVGAIGASYGGFMTMLLQTRTDLFSAAVSHAGISNITSYWGDGFWGFQYSAVASAESFPWDSPELYIDQSPLFHADKITTPLLLLHGDADTNVPPAESMQMFTALQLLGQDVAYVQFEGENHGIVDYSKRIEWTNTIRSWFDKQLKGEAEWWNALYND